MPIRAAAAGSSGGNCRLIRRAVEDRLFAIAREAGLHEQLDVATIVGTGDVEAPATPLGGILQQVLHELEADVAGRPIIEGVELDDGPFVASALVLGTGQAAQAAALLVDAQLVARQERRERQAEEGEDADVAAHRQAECAQRRSASPFGVLCERRDSSPTAARSVSRAVRTRPLRVGRRPACRDHARRRIGCGRRPEPSPGSANSAAIVATRRWKRVSPASSG